MKSRLIRVNAGLLAAIALVAALARVIPAQTDPLAPDPAVVSKFQGEESQHSHIMEVMGYLTDVYGPRLTNSPNIREAADYTVKTLNSWGLSNLHEETWGPFGRGWSNELFEANEVAPRHFPLIAYPKAWTPGTNGPVTAGAIYAKIKRSRILALTAAGSVACLCSPRRCARSKRNSLRRGIATPTTNSPSWRSRARRSPRRTRT